MKRVLVMALSGVISIVSFISQGSAADQKLPVINGKEIAAMVNTEAITLDEYNRALADISHDEMNKGESASKIDYSEILNRLIDDRLFMAEAINIGIDRLPEVINSIDENEKKTLAKMLVREPLNDVKVDEENVDRLFKAATREFKITGAVFENEIDAKKMEEQTGSDKDFYDIVKSVNEAGTAKEILGGRSLKEKELLPQVLDVLVEMEVGAVSPVIKFDEGFLIVKLEDIIFPENPEIRDRIRSSLARSAREESLEKYTASLIEKYVKVDEELLESLDYDISMDEYDNLLKDKRVVAKVKKDGPVTVGELSEAFQEQFYHGVEQHLSRKGLNSKKKELLDELLKRKVLVLEAKKKKIDRTEEYKNRIDKFKKSVIFELFIKKVIASGIKLNEDEVTAYYDQNADEFTNPEMMRIDSLEFAAKEHAEAAMDTLRAGTEFKWLRDNATGQVGNNAKLTLNFGDKVLTVNLLPEEVQQALSGVSSEDFRLHETDDGFFYVLYIKQVFPSSVRPYQEVRQEIVKKIYNDKLGQAMKEWSAKLKEHYPVQVYMTDF